MSFCMKPVDCKYGKILDKAFGVENAMYEFHPGKSVLPVFFRDFAQQILDAPVREDDIWLISFPRTGSTWCQEMIWLIGNNFDYDGARNTVQQLRAPLIEMSTVLFEYTDAFKGVFENSVEYVNNLPSPRYIKSHLPIQLIPTQLDKVKPKIIYTIRNPKDMCVSYYHHCQMFHNMDITFEDFCELFLNDAAPLGSVWNHYLGFWNKRHESNILILKYEDMKKDLRGTLKTIAEFLEKPLSENEMDKMCDFLSIQSMRENKGCNLQLLIDDKKGKDFYKRSNQHFIRKGIVGDWRNYMSPELSSRFDKWIEENTKGTGLTFDY